KLRAARAIMRRIAEAADLPAGTRQLTAETAPRMFTRRDPWTNILRATLATQAALIAGAVAVSVRPYTDALGFADAHARRIARNIPLIMTEESALRQVMDAAGGSHAVEALSRALGTRAWTLFQEIEELGGLAAALASGHIAEMIAKTAARRRKEIATRRRPITGVSEYPNLDERLPQPPAGPTRAALRKQVGLSDPAPAARWEFRPRRLAADFEAYRALSDRLLADEGERPAIFLANIGPIARHNARATFAANAFAAGGIRPVTNDGFTDAGTMAEAFRASSARLAVICGHDEDYATEAAAFAEALKAAGAALVWLAGRPEAEQAEAWRKAGVDRFIGLGSDML
ncbi:MAG: methylmalonyl-CoA mutase, partial [Alphaproteobacteria bacterium]